MTSKNTTSLVSQVPYVKSGKPTGFIHLSIFLAVLWMIYMVFRSKHFRIKTPAFEIERIAHNTVTKPKAKATIKKNGRKSNGKRTK